MATTDSGSEQSEQQSPLPRLLIVDDDLISREVMTLTFEMHGFVVASAEGGEDALRQLAGSTVQPGIILMDTQMPGLSGAALVSALRKKTSARIVAISGSEAGEEVREACDGFLLKPVDPAALLALLGGAASSRGNANPASSESGDGQAELIDPATLVKFQAMMSSKAVREIYQAMASDLGPRLRSLDLAMQANNRLEVARVAHAIKGGCAMIGLAPARDAAAHLETSDNTELWPAELARLREALRELESMLVSGFLK